MLFEPPKNAAKSQLSTDFLTLIVGVLVMRAGISHKIITYLTF